MVNACQRYCHEMSTWITWTTNLREKTLVIYRQFTKFINAFSCQCFRYMAHAKWTNKQPAWPQQLTHCLNHYIYTLYPRVKIISVSSNMSCSQDVYFCLPFFWHHLCLSRIPDDISCDTATVLTVNTINAQLLGAMWFQSRWSPNLKCMIMKMILELV